MPEEYLREQLATDKENIVRESRRRTVSGSVMSTEPMAPMREEIVREQYVPSERELRYAQMTKVRQFLYYILDVAEVFLGLRFLLRLFGANPSSGFTSFVNQVTQPLIQPFRGLFPNLAVGRGGIEWAAVVAMVIYAVVVYAIVHLMLVSERNDPPSAVHTADRHSTV